MQHASIEEVWAVLELSRAPGVGAATLKRLLQTHGLPSRALAAYRARPLASVRRKAQTRDGIRDALRFVDGGGIALHLFGPGYPPLLAALGEPPPVLFVRGQVRALNAPALAIVGARKVDNAGLAAATVTATQAVRAGLVVVSGGARGCDAAAHEAALAAGGATVVVLGSGVDVAYPPEHAPLFDRVVAQGGAIVSELLPGAPPRRSFFLTRNRIIAGLAQGVIVVRGNARSGALTTARWAAKLHRPVASLASADDDALGAASRRLLEDGAPAIGNAIDVAEWVAFLPSAETALARAAALRRPGKTGAPAAARVSS